MDILNGNSVASRVLKIAQREFGADIRLTDDINDDLKVDSLDRIEFGMAIEESFGIEIDYAAFFTWRTLNDVVEYLAGIGDA